MKEIDDVLNEAESDRRDHLRLDMEKTLRAVANGELRLGRVKDVSAGGAVVYLDQPLDEGTEITLDIEDLGSYTGTVSGAARDGLVPIKFQLDQEAEDHLVAEIMRAYNNMVAEGT